MRFLQTIGKSAKSFGRHAGGNFAIVFAVMAPALMLSVGYGINVTQLYHVKSDLGQALDAAVTSTARDLTTGVIAEEDARAVVEAFLTANSGSGFAPAADIKLDRLVVDRAAGTVEASANVEVALAFPLFGASDKRRVSVESASLYSDKTIEFALMLDVTGSMKGDKIDELKIAAEGAVTTMLEGQDRNNPRIRVAMVPYAEAVNVGALARETVFAERKHGPDLPPANEALHASARAGDNCATERKTKDGEADFSDDGPFSKRVNKDDEIYFAKVNRDDRVQVCPEAELVPLTADLDSLLRSIENFHANGVTAGGIAVQWGYYMLSPKWRQAIRRAGLGDGPANHDRENVAKVAILMSDGVFNTAFADVRGKPQNGQGAKARRYAESVCKRMKDDGIEIFTIGFDLNNPSMSKSEQREAKAVLKNCSTPGTSYKHYYEAANGAELDDTLKDIIASVEQLTLTR